MIFFNLLLKKNQINRMKNIFTLLLLLFLQFSISAQEAFEGILTFDIELKDKSGQMSDEDLKQYMGTSQKYYIKGSMYKSEFNGLLQTVTFNEGKDTLFTKMNGQNVLLYKLTNKADEKIISYEFKETDVVILGYKCELLEVKTDKGYHKYFFNRDLKNDPEAYKNHKAGLWDFFTSKTDGALSIISISNTDEFASKIVLTSVNRKKLDDSIFERPKMPIQKMPED